MGLDITAYRALNKVQNAEVDADGHPVDGNQWRARHLNMYDENFPGRSEGLEDNAIYSAEDTFKFSAGSYSGYNRWRDELAVLAGYKSADDCWSSHQNGPFYELINFTDCDGVIGPVIAAKLAMDFAAFREKAQSAGGFFFDSYGKWQKAFGMAAESGAIVFH